jgi:hypothetical protein
MKENDFKLKGLDEYTDSAIIEEIRRVAKRVNQSPLTVSAFKRHANVGMSTIRRHFGSWRDALSAASLIHLVNDARSITAKMIAQHGKRMSDDELLSILRDVAQALRKESITSEEFNQRAPISAATLSRRFHGWANAMKLAGLNPTKVQRRYSDDKCFENLLKVWTHYGRPPKFTEMPQPPSTISTQAYTKRWGTWRKALKAFVERINQDIGVNAEDDRKSEETVQTNRISQKHSLESPKPDSDKHAIKLGLRYEVLKRDRFRCVICGRSPANTLGLELHVDHVVPFTAGGKTLQENLRSTCSECNLGKGSKT